MALAKKEVKDMKGAISRSAGIPVRVNGIPVGLVGSGYRGKTEELDLVVQKAAELLANFFQRDIEIRFNSDQESGGAFIKDKKKGMDGSCQVGLCAGLRPEYPNHMSYRQWCESQGLEMFSEEAHTMERRLPEEIYHDTVTAIHVLKDGVANQYPEDECESKNQEDRYWRYDGHIYIFHESQEAAFNWLRENVVRDQIRQV